MAMKKKMTEEAPERQTGTATTEKTAAEQTTPEAVAVSLQSGLTDSADSDQEEEHGEQTPKIPEEQEAASDLEENVEAPAPKLESLSVLADRHRVVGWQQAALLRLMGWEDDKRVSEAEYATALDGLKTRRIGGGRR